MSAAAEIAVGVIGRPWGTRGQFLLDPRGSDPGTVLARGRLNLRLPGGGVAEYPIVKSHFAGGKLIVQVEGCRSREEAETLRGAEVLVPASEFEPIAEEGYYPHELVGLSVVRAGCGTVIGTVQAVLETAGTDILSVRSGPREILIPFASSICKVRKETGAIEIDPPDGLLDLNTEDPCASRS